MVNTVLRIIHTQQHIIHQLMATQVLISPRQAAAMQNSSGSGKATALLTATPTHPDGAARPMTRTGTNTLSKHINLKQQAGVPIT